MTPIRILIVTIVVFTTTAGYGQVLQDALRYSVLNPSGTAAFTAIGGVGGAFGGDYSTIHVNPAGLADYRRDVFVITPVLSNYTGDASIAAIPGNNTSANRNRFGIGNIGYISSNESYKPKLRRINVALGFTRVADFNSTASFMGSSAGSILDFFAEAANSQGAGNLSDFDAGLAEAAGALIFDDFNFEYFTDLDGVDADQPIFKEQDIVTSGSMNELNFSLAGNLSDKFNFGFHLGIPIINFNQVKTYREVGPGLTISPFQTLRFEEEVSTSGAGLNFKAGMQYKITPKFRLGAAVHSPTIMSLTDDFINTLDYSYNSDEGTVASSATSPNGTFRYRFTNPWRLILSAGSVYSLGNLKGFITGDIEILDYGNANFGLGAFSDNPADIAYGQALNDEIGRELTNAINYRLGTELGYNKWRFRAGVNLLQSALDDDEGAYNTTLSLGIGYRVNDFFIDAAFRRITLDTEEYYPYFDGTVEGDPEVGIDRALGSIAITTGFLF